MTNTSRIIGNFTVDLDHFSLAHSWCNHVSSDAQMSRAIKHRPWHASISACMLDGYSRWAGPRFFLSAQNHVCTDEFISARACVQTIRPW
jgi:hypothetical protein